MDFMELIKTRRSIRFFEQDPINEKVWLQCGTGLTEKQLQVPTANSIVGQVIESGNFVMEHDLEEQAGAHDVVAVKTGFVTRSALCVPVNGVTSKKVVGAIQMLNKVRGEFSDDDRRILDRLAYHLQMNIENIYLRQELATMATEMDKKIKKLEAKLG